MPRPKLPDDISKTQHVSARFTSDEEYSIELLGRELQISKSEVIRKSVRKILTDITLIDDEPTPGIEFIRKPEPPLYNVGLWRSDPSERLFVLATFRRDLLTPNERRFFTLYSMYMESSLQSISVETFRKFYNSDGIDTKHLSEAGD